MVADYTQTLDTRPQQSGAIGMYNPITEMRSFSHAIHIADDGTEQRIAYSDEPVLFVEMEWEWLDPIDAGTVFDWYFDSAKAFGKERSFYWRHPTDGVIYVARFDMDLERNIDSITGQHGLPNVRLKILGTQ